MLFLAVLFSVNINAQTYSFRSFSTGSGIPDSYVYAINQDKGGFLWVATGHGLVKFDGFSFHQIPYPDSVFTRYVTTLFRDSNGRMWSGCNDGSLFYSDGNILVKSLDLGIQSVNAIFESSDGYIYIIPQEKYIIRINAGKPDDMVWYKVPSGIIMTSAAFTDEGEIVLGTTENLLLCRLDGDSLKVSQVIEGIEYTRVQSVLKASNNNIYLIGTEGSGLFTLHFHEQIPSLSRPASSMLPENLDIRYMMEAADGSVWISTFGSGLLKTSFKEGSESPGSVIRFDKAGGLQGNDVRCSFEDEEGNIWAGMYGEGMSLLLSQAYWHHAPGTLPEENNIIYIAPAEREYFAGTPSGYFMYLPDGSHPGKFTDLSRRINSDVLSYFYDNQEIYAGTRGNGIFHVSRQGRVRQFFLSENTGKNYIRHITADNKNLWVSTLEGVVVLDKKEGSLVANYNIDSDLPHNSINQVYILNSGTAVAATESDRLYKISLDDGVEVGSSVMSGTTRNKVLCYTQSGNGDIWAGTEGNGVFWFSGDSLIRITTENGLFSNYCYSIFADSMDKIWIGHERGFTLFDPSTGSVKTFQTAFAKNGNCNHSAIIEDRNGRVVIGTTEGLIIYDRSKETEKTIIPRTRIVGVTINNTKLPVRDEYRLPYGRYTIKIDFVGIYLSDPGDVLYSSRMENWSENWSEPNKDRQVPFTLTDGSYTFSVISYNSLGLTDNEAASIYFNIRRPVWRTWWFILLSVLAVSSALFFIIKEREKAQKRQKKELADELDRRTREVVRQKEEIQQQNIEITDSISYAKRIQASILPDTNKLKNAFADAFVIFHPRDIVSGDFYWFDTLDDKRFMLVCADSTGHGVPGAFMSMIGSTLLQDIISRKGIIKPSQVLALLDKQIISTLNQNVEFGVSNDGMDMVVCAINIADRHIRFASAMRPVIIVMGGESYYIKGNRCSVGGESVIEKYFDDQEYYLGKGDSIYMFSDGFPDQFGGADGKKMKIARLKTLIEDVHHLPMTQQKEIINKFYFDWKGAYDQVDDVLMMGLKF